MSPKRNQVLTVEVRFRFPLSLRDALALRLAGSEVRKMVVEEIVSRMEDAVQPGADELEVERDV